MYVCVVCASHTPNTFSNLITKNKFFDKPVYEALEASLIELRERCFALSVDHIAMPQIGACVSV